MAYLTVDGVTALVFRDTPNESEIDNGDLRGRSVGGVIYSSRGSTKRIWKMRTPPMAPDEATALRKWLKGRGQRWSFDNTQYSSAGVCEAFASTYTNNAAGGKHGGRITVGSASDFTVDLSDKLYLTTSFNPSTHGFSWGFWRYNVTGAAEDNVATAWYHYLLVGTASYTRASASNPANLTQYRNGVAGSYNVGQFTSIDASTGVAAIYGYCSAGAFAAGARDYDDMWIVPYQVPSSWRAGLYTHQNSYAMGNWPNVRAVGDFAEDDPVDVYITINSVDQINGTLNGTRYNNAQVIEFTMEEV
jgi:hypothetical protein